MGGPTQPIFKSHLFSLTFYTALDDFKTIDGGRGGGDPTVPILISYFWSLRKDSVSSICVDPKSTPPLLIMTPNT